MDNQMASLLIRQLEAIRQELKAQTTVIAQREDAWTPDVKRAADLADAIAGGVTVELNTINTRVSPLPVKGPVDTEVIQQDLPKWHMPKMMGRVE